MSVDSRLEPLAWLVSASWWGLVFSCWKNLTLCCLCWHFPTRKLDLVSFMLSILNLDLCWLRIDWTIVTWSRAQNLHISFLFSSTKWPHSSMSIYFLGHPVTTYIRFSGESLVISIFLPSLFLSRFGLNCWILLFYSYSTNTLPMLPLTRWLPTTTVRTFCCFAPYRSRHTCSWRHRLLQPASQCRGKNDFQGV